MISTDIEASNDHSIPGTLSKWINFPLKQLQGQVKYIHTVLMGDYLIVLVHRGHFLFSYPYDSEEDTSSESESDQGEIRDINFLLAVDLRDNSVQIAENMIDCNGDYTLTKYKDNQIIKFGGETDWYKKTGDVVQITIESFEPLSVKYVKLKGDDSHEEYHPRLVRSTAQIYKDHLYIFGGADQINYKTNELWSFDLDNLIWKLCETTGEAPGGRSWPNSSVIGDNLLIYGGVGCEFESESESETETDTTKDIFVLNFNSMSWTRVEQIEKHLLIRFSNYGADFNGHAYKDHLLILAAEEQNDDISKRDMLCCWNPGI